MKAFMAAYKIYKHTETQNSLLFIPANHILLEQVSPHTDLETVVVRMLPVCTMRSPDFMSPLRESIREVLEPGEAEAKNVTRA